MNDTISLSEKIYLLGINPKKGGIVMAANSAMNYVLIGGLLLELSLKKNIVFEKNRIVIKNNKSSNSLHQFMLDKIGKSNKELKISTWISKFTFSIKFIKKEVQQALMKKRVIKMVQRRFLFFHWGSPEIVNFQVLYKLLAKIESQVFKGTDIEEELVLLSFLKPAGLLTRIFPDREKRKHAKEKLNLIMNKNQLSIATNNAIAAAQAVEIAVSVLNSVNSTSSIK